MDLINILSGKVSELDFSIKQLRVTGNAYAEAERDYKIALSKEALDLKATKGMAVTLIDKVIYGMPTVAEARFKRDIAEVMHKANLEHINATKLQIRIIESQLDREWKHSS